MATTLEEIAPELIDRNDENPRIHFREAGLDRLAESIEEAGGILVPVYIYRDPAQEGRFRLIDGERRWLMALRLGLDKIPAIIRESPPDDAKNIVEMFNIHKVREDWEDMPTARALKQVMDRTGMTDVNALRDLTGLSREQIARYLLALELSPEYQELIDSGDVPMNFFVELDRNVIKPLARNRVQLAEEFAPQRLQASFLAKRDAGALADLIDLRKVKPIIQRAERDAGSPEDASALDDYLRRLFTQTTATIDEAYEESVAFSVERDKLTQRAKQLVGQFEHLLGLAGSDEEREALLDAARETRDALNIVLGENN